MGGFQLHHTRFTRQGQNITIDGGRALHHLERDRQSRRGGSHQRNRFIENQLVRNVSHLDELGVAVGLLAHKEVVETARATLGVEENTVPHLVVVLVAATRGKVHADVGAARHLNPLALAARLDEHRHGTCAVVGREVERHLVTCPATFLVVEGDVAAVR